MTPQIVRLLLTAVLATVVAAEAQAPDRTLPERASAELVTSLDAAARHDRHVWRDTPAFNDDGTVNAYVEISRGDRRKWEFDMARNARAIDRVMPAEVGGYPVNYGFVPQTVSFDGDPFDALVLGPPIEGGGVVRGVIVGLMHMEDETGIDPKVVLVVAGGGDRSPQRLDAEERQRIANYFGRYKRWEGKVSSVPGWGTAADGRAHVQVTHAFFRECRRRSGTPCAVAP